MVAQMNNLAPHHDLKMKYRNEIFFHIDLNQVHKIPSFKEELTTEKTV